MKSVTLFRWLTETLQLAGKKPLVWSAAVLAIGVLLCLARISLALGILASVSGLFVGVGVAAAIDRQPKVTVPELLKQHLPTSVSLAVLIMLCWLMFRVLANLYSGEPERIPGFFFDWELTAGNLQDKTFFDLAGWLYSAGIVSLILVLLMLASYGNWFSYPLMVFQQCRWSEARDRGRQVFKNHGSMLNKLSIFLMLGAFFGLGVLPLLTPLYYMFIATLMYVSYRDLFA